MRKVNSQELLDAPFAIKKIKKALREEIKEHKKRKKIKGIVMR